MATEIVVPEFGESVVEATVGHWLKAEGQPIEAGEPVVELETEKVNTEVSSAEAGVLTRISHKEGDTVHPGEVLGVVEGRNGAMAPTRPEPQPERTEETPRATVPADTTPPPTHDQAATAPPPSEITPPAEEGDVERARVSPAAQRLAAELGVRLARVRGTGPGGRIMREDVEDLVRRDRAAARPAQEAPPSPAPPAAPPQAPAAQPGPRPAAAPAVQPAPAEQGRPELRQRLSRRRATIARRLVEMQQTTAMLTTFNEIDMTAVMDLRRRRREAFRQATGVDLGYMSFFVKAVVGALKAYPQLNAELQGDELVLKKYYDIGIAIGDPEGLVVPVVRNADKLSFAQIEQTIGDYVQKVKDHTLTLEDLRGGTFTITNGGVFGSLMSTPMLNPPQVGILGMHRIMDRPVAADGQVVIRPMMYVALSYDHRVADGRESVQFLVRVKQLLEDPERLLLEG